MGLSFAELRCLPEQAMECFPLASGFNLEDEPTKDSCCFVLFYSYDAKCDVWSIGCILWDMANTANRFVFVSSNTILHRLRSLLVRASMRLFLLFCPGVSQSCWTECGAGFQREHRGERDPRTDRETHTSGRYMCTYTHYSPPTSPKA